ncbi:MAG: fibronectin type III domain-containing protein [Candidatus Paceibacterota bacterium]
MYRFILAVLFVVTILAALPATATHAQTFTKDLFFGIDDAEVYTLQQFLNNQGFLVSQNGSGSPGQETDKFRRRTEDSVIRFQEAYAADILAPLGLSSGTGYWGQLSRDKAHELLGDTTTTTLSPLSVGDRIEVTTSGTDLNVRDSAAGTLIGTQPNGALGTLVSGPVSASGYVWWEVDYDSGTDGWSAETYLTKTDSTTTEPGTTDDSLPTVSFPSNTPTTYTLGSGVDIPFTVDGTMPSNGDILIIAWHYDEARLVDEFAHALNASPWEIAPEQMDLIPEGSANLQLLLRTVASDGTITVHERVTHDIKIASATLLSAPSTPTNLSATADSSSRVSLSWSDVSSETSYILERSTGSGFSRIALLDENTTTYADTGLSANTTYTYRVRARNSAGDSGYSSEAKATTESESDDETLTTASVPSTPTNLSATADSTSAIFLSWSDVADETSYVLERSTGSGFNQIATLAENTTSYTDTDLSSGTTYTYRIKARNSAGDSGYSSEAKATTESESDGGTTSVSTTWTALPDLGNGREIYVSSSRGDNSNDGLSPERPVQTLRTGYSLLRDGYPDRLLLRRGDTFASAMPYITKSGRSKSEPMVITGYGVGPRPVLEPSGDDVTAVIRKNWSSTINHFWIIGLDIYNRGADPKVSGGGTATNGVLWMGPRSSGSKDILFENNRVRYFSTNVIFQFVDDLRARNNVIAYAYSDGNSHSQGLTGRYNSNILIENNVFDRNGWNPDVEGAGRTIFNHNIYLKENTDGVIRNNIIARGSSQGIKISSDTTAGFNNISVRNNLFVDNRIGADMGHSSDKADYSHRDMTFRDNVFIDQYVWQFGAASADGLIIERNLFANKLNASSQPVTHLLDDRVHRNITIRDNVVYNWPMNNDGPVFPVPSLASNVTIQNNTIEYQGHTDPTRNVDSYHASIGGVKSLESFLVRAVAQERSNWDDRYAAQPVNNYIRAGFDMGMVAGVSRDNQLGSVFGSLRGLLEGIHNFFFGSSSSDDIAIPEMR